jgi:hypothetical protein
MYDVEQASKNKSSGNHAQTGKRVLRLFSHQPCADTLLPEVMKTPGSSWHQGYNQYCMVAPQQHHTAGVVALVLAVPLFPSPSPASVLVALQVVRYFRSPTQTFAPCSLHCIESILQFQILLSHRKQPRLLTNQIT